MGIRPGSGTVIGEIRLDLRHKKSPFKMTPIYEMMHEWLMDEGYKPEGPSDTFYEKYYWQSTNQRGKDIWFWWRSFAGEDKTMSKYFEYHIDLEVQILGLNDTEVIINDKKEKMNLGEVNFSMRGYLLFDPKGELQKHPFVAFFYETFAKRWLRDQVVMHRDKVREDLYKLYGMIKKYLEHTTSEEEFPNYHPEKGIGY